MKLETNDTEQRDRNDAVATTAAAADDRARRQLTRPPDEARIWRYLSLARFLALLHDGALFFSRLDELEDRFEGFAAKPSWERFIGRVTPG